MNFADRLTEFEAECAESVSRIRAQAARRAESNGICKVTAAMEAERRWHPGASHEPIIESVAGPFRRVA